jgi:hypothetical protein
MEEFLDASISMRSINGNKADITFCYFLFDFVKIWLKPYSSPMGIWGTGAKQLGA